MANYIIIRAESIHELQHAVNLAIRDGYLIQGGAVPYGGPDRFCFIQTMLKPANNP